MSSQPNTPLTPNTSPTPQSQGNDIEASSSKEAIGAISSSVSTGGVSTVEGLQGPDKTSNSASVTAQAAQTSLAHPKKKKKNPWTTVLKFGGAIVLSLALTWYMVSKVNLHQMLNILEHGVDYRWLWCLVGFTILSHAIRGYRWGFQLEEINVHLPLQTLCVSIFGAYALNLVIPYIGEAWRIVFAAKRGNQSITKVVGTDGGDRISDFVVIVALLILMLIVAHSYLGAFLDHFKVGERIMSLVSQPWLWISIVAGLGAIVLIFYYCRHQKWMKKTVHALSDVWTGFAVLFTMKHKWAYFWLTLGIWFCYFMKVYICFFAFSFTRALVTPQLAWGLLPGLVAFVFGSMSMAIPSNGGLGPWNIAVIFGLSLFSVGYTEAAAFAMIVWSVQSLTIVCLGIYSAIYVSVTSKKAKAKSKAATVAPAQPALQEQLD